MYNTNPSSISGPHTFENLSLYMLHGVDLAPSGSYRVLKQSMDRKETIVHETGNVGELLIENRGDVDVFIQAGDIVKGGRQDRVMGVDLIVGCRSGRVPVPSFCVEKGRWSKRGAESDQQFSSSTTAIASKAVKISARLFADQSMVWDSISKEQEKLSAATQTSVKAKISHTSYQLSLESEELQTRIRRGITQLTPLCETHADIVGFVFAINGELNCADSYGSHDLFTQLWEKLLTAAVTEAAAESKAISQRRKDVPSLKAVERFLAKKASELKGTHPVTSRVLLKEYQNEEKARFETEDLERGAVCVHTSVLSS